MLIIFTGNGKSKTTAALGCAMRALGHGRRVLMVQFIKSGQNSGEQKLKIRNFKIVPVGKGFVKILGDKKHFSVHQKAAQNALKLAQRLIKSKRWDLVVLDEINVAVNLKLIRASDVLKILKSASKNTDIILTGRGAPKSFIQKADLVTEMKEIKHPFKKGQVTKKGIEF